MEQVIYLCVYQVIWAHRNWAQLRAIGEVDVGSFPHPRVFRKLILIPSLTSSFAPETITVFSKNEPSQKGTLVSQLPLFWYELLVLGSLFLLLWSNLSKRFSFFMVESWYTCLKRDDLKMVFAGAFAYPASRIGICFAFFTQISRIATVLLACQLMSKIDWFFWRWLCRLELTS